MRHFWIIVTCLLASAFAVFAQEDEESNGFIVNLIQDSLSTENRQIRLRGIDGLLASSARVEEILVSDQKGPWLIIKEADIVWTRRALFSKRLKIDSLKAASIQLIRPPLPDPSLPTLEAEPFSLPELPLSVEIGVLDVPKIEIGEELLGQSVSLALNGFITLADGSLDTKLDVLRTDRAGVFAVEASYQNESRQLDVDLAFQEPDGGLVATLLKIEGAPELDVSIKGSGPLEDIDIKLDANSQNQQILIGDLSLREAEGGLGFDADLSGQLAGLIAPQYREFFAGQSKIEAAGQTRDNGGFDLETLSLDTASLRLSGGLSTTDDGFLRRAELTGTLGDKNAPTVLPFGSDISVGQVDLDVNFGVDPTGLWSVKLKGEDLGLDQVAASDFSLIFQGTVDGIETPERRALSINAIGDVSGLSAATPDLTRALGQRLTFQLASDWTPGTYRINRARIGGAAARIELEGDIEDLGFDGDISAKITRLAPFGGALGRDLQGSADLTLSGLIKPLTGSFDLTVDGTSQALKLDIGAVDPLLAGTTELSGQLIRNETGFRSRNLSLANDQITLSSDGVLASDRADLTFNAVLADLGIVTNRASGEVSFAGSAKGENGEINLESVISAPKGTLLDKPLEQLIARFTGLLKDGQLAGQLAGNGSLDESPLSLFAGIETSPQGQDLSGLRFTVGPTRLTGDLFRATSGLMEGNLDLTSPDVSLLATLFLQEATGRANATITLEPNPRGQQIIAKSDLSEIVTSALSLGRADLDVILENALGIPTIAGGLVFSDTTVGGIGIHEGSLSATGKDGRTDFSGLVALTNETDIKTRGALSTTEDGFDIELSKLDVDRNQPILRLENSATARIIGNQIDLDRLDLAIGEGRLSATGRVDEALDISLKLTDIPLAVANAIRDDLGLGGLLSGEALITGPSSQPNLGFDLAAIGITATALSAADLPPLDITASGETLDQILTLGATLTGPNRLNSEVIGTVSLEDLALDLKGSLNAFPLALIDRAAGGQGLRGIITGGFNLLGVPAKPRINFDLTGSGISVAAMRDNAIGALSFATTGSFVNDVITLPDARIQGAEGMNFSLSGRMPLRLDGLDVAANGTIPLSVATVALARSGMSASGVANLSLRADGRLTAPNLSGTASLNGSTFVSSRANLRLDDVSLNATFSGNKLNINSVSARNSKGGTINANGSITIDPLQGLPVDISTTVQDLRYTDGRLATALASGSLTLSGAILRQSQISGEITIDELEVSLPQQLGTAKSYQLNVAHVNTTPEVRRTLKRAGLTEIPAPEVKSDSDISFDVTVNAPRQVFVRGRGVDAELGGSLKLGGTTSNIKPVGQFNLIRGRINILARRIDLDEGFIRLEGNTNPDIYLEARTVADDVEAVVTLEGPASKPVLSFSSVPELPDDEVLARLVFDRALSDLSALQVAQLAAAAGELSGRTGPSFFSQLRDATGLDDLDFETDNQGKTTVRVGKYIQENIYSSLEADNRGSSRATINLDINQNFTAKGTLDNEGNTSFGIFFEKDY